MQPKAFALCVRGLWEPRYLMQEINKHALRDMPVQLTLCLFAVLPAGH